jgi:hypothetical protein
MLLFNASDVKSERVIIIIIIAMAFLGEKVW